MVQFNLWLPGILDNISCVDDRTYDSQTAPRTHTLFSAQSHEMLSNALLDFDYNHRLVHNVDK